MKKKLVGILMGVAMTATTIAAPTAIFADDIDIEDIAVETEEDDVAVIATPIRIPNIFFFILLVLL